MFFNMHWVKQLQKTEEMEMAQRQKEHRPVIQQDEGKINFHDSAEFMTIDQCETMRELGDSQLVGTQPPLPSTSTSTALAVTRDVQMADVQNSIAVKRKRGRPPRAQGKTGPTTPQNKQAVVDEEEDVCFICFDGGSLVLCDRRGCPKAYHPSCIKRDEEFFRSKAKWNCGWHICSSCQKASYYMCYTCTYSLCKGCTKDADYVCVRSNKGFCGTCRKTIMLIENVKMENVEQVVVDFDDKTSWEYLFKVYWVYLKDKESLSIDELLNAKNPWKGDELPKARNSWRRNGFATRKDILTGEHVYANNEKVYSLHYCGRNDEETLSKQRKTNDQSNQIEKSSLDTDKSTVEKVTSFPEGKIWATKALVEFVSHMKDGDLSMLSQSEVQDLLLEYINRNNLRDPHQKTVVVCDARLKNLFRKPRVGHLEMLKLLEYHFLTNERPPPGSTVNTTVSDALSRQLKGAGCNDSQLAEVNDRHHITNRMMNEKGSPINPNADEYAAIDVHNINLLYLKSNLMEKLMDDAENFQEKVVGSFVRIRVAVSDTTQDVYRLVQVVGTCKEDESYKVGSRTTNTKLEVLNLGRKEAISIDEISNQDFSEDECRRLRETVKCGLIKPLKVGEILVKAMLLQPVKVEILQLTNLHERASEREHRKERREYVGKLELLKSPKERERRLLEIPNVHMDPKMDPNYVSKENAEDRDDNGQGITGDHVRLNNSTGVARNGIELNSSPGEGDLNDFGHRALKTLAAASEQVEMNSRLDLQSTLHIQDQGNAVCGPSMPNTLTNQLGDTGSETPSSGNEMPVSYLETEKLWNYWDPSGKIQGPFSMLQLRKWSDMKIFPDDFRVWRVNEKQQDSILLTEALIGRFPEKPLQPSVPEEPTVNRKQEHGHGLGTDATREDNERADHEQKQLQNDGQLHGNTSNGPGKSNGLDSHSMPWIKAADAAVTDGSNARAPLQVKELPEGSKPSTGQSQICVSLPASLSCGNSNEVPLLSKKEWSSNPSNAGVKEHAEKQSESAGYSSQPVENFRPQSINSSTIGSSFLSMVKPIAKPEQNQKFDFSNMPSTAPLQASEAPKNLVPENKLPASTNILVQDSVQPNWSTASTIVIGDRQVPAVSVDWLSFSSAPTKNPVEQWDINLESPSSRKPGGTTGDQTVTPTSGVDQLTLSSSSHPTINAPNWHSMVPEPSEFCSLVDESVSDLLAEVEAMESLNGLPSPTSKFRYDLELAPGSDDDCFSPVERFNPAPDQSKSNAVSSTSEIQIPSQLPVVEESLCLSLMPTQPTVTNEPLAVSQMPAQLDLSNKPPHLQQEIVQNKPSPVTEEPLSIWKRDPTDPHKSLNGQQPSSAGVNGNAKHREVSINQWDMNLDVQPLESSAEQHQVGPNLQAPVTPTVSQLEHGSNKNSGSAVDTSRITDKGTPSSGHGATQQQASTKSGVSSSRIQGNWGSQSRHGSDSRHSSHRENRHHYHSRDSGLSRDRSSSQRDNRSQGNWDRWPAYGSGRNVGGSYKGSSRGQRVCKFYESGYCKRGASCSYWHP